MLAFAASLATSSLLSGYCVSAVPQDNAADSISMSASDSASSTVMTSTSASASESASSSSGSTSSTSASASVKPTHTLATLSSPSGASDELQKLTRLLPKVLENAVAISSHSWELGALTQALLEVYDPQFTPFEWDPEALKDRPLDATAQFFDVVKDSLAPYSWAGSPSDTQGENEKRDTDHAWLDKYLDLTTAEGQTTLLRPLIDGAGALGDPCSLGPAVWLVSYLTGCRDDLKNQDFKDAKDYAWAVGNQLKYLNNGVKSDNYTISMREVETFVAWSDMGYMIPPFLAYLGMATESADLLGYALDQWRLESSSLLRKPDNLFAHITAIDPQYTWDDKIWATGNGWMTYGLVRVLASIEATHKRDAFIGQTDKFHDELIDVFSALFVELNGDSLLPNYMKLAVANETESQGESAGTALVVAAFYRLAVLAPDKSTEDLFGKAEQAFNGVVRKLHDDGWLDQVVDPSGNNGWNVMPGVQSPEGQSFLGMMWAGRVAYENKKGGSST